MSSDSFPLTEVRGGSPRWLLIARDAAILVACVLFSAALVVGVLILSQAASSVGDLVGMPSPTPCTYTPDCGG
jgi:hypothetical protein